MIEFRMPMMSEGVHSRAQAIGFRTVRAGSPTGFREAASFN